MSFYKYLKELHELENEPQAEPGKDMADAIRNAYWQLGGEHPPAKAPQPGKRAPHAMTVNVKILDMKEAQELKSVLFFCLAHMREDHADMARRRIEKIFD